MRLSKIKLAGFKSFVDPTTIPLPSNLVGVVGPNGCGKSNTIDAVRWVMGETSAKHLRGDSMEDVIFNGSSSRKPVGQAFIELVFDNSDGSLGGEYAKYSEISIKRQVSRDGQSSYFLNGTRCRRRDITDIFLGTGLGPRSYAIIEQGMISRLIEAKPEELRVYLEEAAGISKYKERRRETENRIRHSRENLERLTDLREEVEKQLNHLNRQARTAEKFKELRAEAERVHAELLALRLRDLNTESENREREIAEQDTALEMIRAQLRHVESEIEKDREAQTEANEAFNEVQGRYYRHGNEISRVEQDIQHQREMQVRMERELREAERSLEEVQGLIQNDESRLHTTEQEIAELEPAHAKAQEELAAANRSLEAAEVTLRELQQEWDAFNQRASSASQNAQVQRTRMEHLEREIGQRQERLKKLETERDTLTTAALEEEIEALRDQLQAAEKDTEAREARLKDTIEQINTTREENRTRNSHIDELGRRLQTQQGRLASLETLQQAALGKNQEAVVEWLDGQGLKQARRLAEQLDVDGGWENAVETVLGHALEAVCVDDLDTAANALSQLDKGSVTLFDVQQGAAQDASAGQDALAMRVRAPWPLASLMSGVRTADSLDAALAMRSRLADNESVITPDGLWLGRNWLRVSRESEAHVGVLAREQEIKTLQAEIDDLGGQLQTLKEELESGRDRLRQFEAEREELQVELNRAHRARADINIQIQNRSSRMEQVGERRQRLIGEIEELRAQIETGNEQLREATEVRNQALRDIEMMETEREALSRRREEHNQRLDELRSEARRFSELAHERELRLQSARTTLQTTREGLDRLRAQRGQLQQRCQELTQQQAQGGSPIEALEGKLAELLAGREVLEKELHAARDHLSGFENALREKEKNRQDTERRLEDHRAGLERLRLANNETLVRRDTVGEQLRETDFDIEKLYAEMAPEANIEAWQARHEDLETRIQRLGPINLAAIEEYQEQQQRKAYLDAQNDDLQEALETLE
ncbi:MAG: chromosome segregation protein SMC, partial [Acidihalobacter sp.]